jgi:membrane fusion protein (multidrug efflux system)
MANLSVAEATGKQATANRLSTIGNRNANNALIENSTVETNPEVRLAKARYEQAKVNLTRTVIHAPISGIVAKRQVEVGQQIQMGAPLLTVVPVNKMHIDANFKEGKLRKVKVGQKVEVTADLYGDDIIYHGVVTGLSGGTGSAFSMIPAQNATGNWIKVVQRLPVRIELDRDDLLVHPLQVGLSMAVSIDTASMVDQETLEQYKSFALEQAGGQQDGVLLSQDGGVESVDEQGI